jgi:hypothetical protein
MSLKKKNVSNIFVNHRKSVKTFKRRFFQALVNQERLPKIVTVDVSSTHCAISMSDDVHVV